MKFRVKLTRTVELSVEGESEDEVMNWLNETTPEGAYLASNGNADESYHDEIICPIRDDSYVDYVIQ